MSMFIFMRDKRLLSLNCQALAPKPYSPNPLGPSPTQFKTRISTKGTGADTKIMGATTTPTHHKLLSMKEGSHNKTHSEWTWSSPKCSVRTLSILLVAPLSKFQHPGYRIQCKKDPMRVYHLPCYVNVDKNMVEQSSTVPGLVVSFSDISPQDGMAGDQAPSLQRL